ncbi:Cytochrome P450 [Amanita muscaria]
MQYRGSLFKIPTVTSWVVVVTSASQIDELRRADDDILSPLEAARDALHANMTIGPEPFDDPFNIDAIKGPLTRNIGAKFADVQDEIAAAFEEYIPIKGDEWFKFTAYTTIMDIVCRASNRMLVGLPLCRDPDWMDLNKRFTLDMVKASIVLTVIPATLRPAVAPFLRDVSKGIERGTKHIEPLIKERLENEAQHGKDWPGRPNDIISWLFDVTRERPRSTLRMVKAILMTNFAAIHTTTMTLTTLMYELTKHQEYIRPLREEIETVIAAEGWSKSSVRKMCKLDSFIKECLRLSDMGLLLMNRKALKDFTFRNGMTIPAGSIVSVPYLPVHTDTDNFTDPQTFDGFRFEKLRSQEGEELKHQLVTTGVDYVLFGHGRHGCPGRFFVVNEVKVLLAHVLLKYDVKMADGKDAPKCWQFGTVTGPNMLAKIMFRKRQEA